MEKLTDEDRIVEAMARAMCTAEDEDPNAVDEAGNPNWRWHAELRAKSQYRAHLAMRLTQFEIEKERGSASA